MATTSKKYYPEKIVSNVLKIASLPDIYLKINELLSNPNYSNNGLAKIIQEDPALTARILRVTNSAMYNMASKIETIAHAINILGSQQLRDIVLSCSVLEIFKVISDDILTMEDFWKHSVACGLMARALAAQMKENNIERFFVIGLLHDIGRLILLIEIPHAVGEILQLAQDNAEILYKAERQVLGFDHARLGSLLLEKWKLPPRICESIKYHHKPNSSTVYPLEAAVLHVSDLIIHTLQIGSSGSKFVPIFEEESWKLLNLEIADLENCLAILEEQYEDAIQTILN